jgi:hypothetical protein
MEMPAERPATVFQAMGKVDAADDMLAGLLQENPA